MIIIAKFKSLLMSYSLIMSLDAKPQGLEQCCEEGSV